MDAEQRGFKNAALWDSNTQIQLKAHVQTNPHALTMTRKYRSTAVKASGTVAPETIDRESQLVAKRWNLCK
ncbi:hypothetical protein evm_010120 [Chilo suppressalis]|nr:hypothetical protein evm_010120 [Chilo suppressalis]